jgi:hypothetical protein
MLTTAITVAQGTCPVRAAEENRTVYMSSTRSRTEQNSLHVSLQGTKMQRRKDLKSKCLNINEETTNK